MKFQIASKNQQINILKASEESMAMPQELSASAIDWKNLTGEMEEKVGFFMTG
jgi:hypothetical protein